MLARVYEDLFKAVRVPIHLGDDRGRLHEVGAGADDVQDLHSINPQSVSAFQRSCSSESVIRRLVWEGRYKSENAKMLEVTLGTIYTRTSHAFTRKMPTPLTTHAWHSRRHADRGAASPTGSAGA